MPKPFRFIVYYLLNSLATSNFDWYKSSSNIILIAIFITTLISGNIPLKAIVAFLLFSIPLIRFRIPLYIAILSILPALPAFLIGIIFASLTIAINSFVKAYTISMLTLAILHYINISEIAFIAEKIRRGSSIYIMLIFKSIPQVLKEVEEALFIAETKGKEIWRGIAVATLATYEHGVLHEEGLYTKNIYRVTLRYRVSAIIYTVIILILILIMSILYQG